MIWLSGYLVPKITGNAEIWRSAVTKLIWLSGYLVIWLSGYLAVWLSGHDSCSGVLVKLSDFISKNQFQRFWQIHP
jgi:hypothetical protein